MQHFYFFYNRSLFGKIALKKYLQNAEDML